MKYQRLVWLLLMTIFALTPKTARAQLWSNPTLVAQVSELGGPAQLLRVAGDTLRLVAGARDTLFGVARMTEYWNAGDSWCGPDVFWSDSVGDFWVSGRAALDPQRRIWATWSSVIPSQWPPYYSDGAVWFALRDNLGWQPADRADQGLTEAPFGMSFTGDRGGDWYLGWGYSDGGGTQFGSGARYQLWQDSLWGSRIRLRSGFQESYGRPSLSPDPDSGAWAVISHGNYGTDELLVYRLIGGADSLRFSISAPSYVVSDGIATDSAGRIWVIYVVGDYVHGGELHWVGIEREQIVDSGLVSTQAVGTVLAAVDPQGVVWAVWRHDSAVWTSYNRGRGWTEPEVVADSSSLLDCIAFDGEGLPQVVFERMTGQQSQICITRRLSHVGAAERRPTKQPGPSVRLLSSNPCAGEARVEFLVGGETRVDLRVRDITGRTVAVLADGILRPGVYCRDWRVAPSVPNGVYFLNFAAGPHNTVQKLVLTR
jgi:hypothetical protein